MGFCEVGEAARMRTIKFILLGSGPRRCMSSGAKPASRKRFCMALAAAVTLPLGVSVVLISMSCLKMSRASARWAGDAVGGHAHELREPARLQDAAPRLGALGRGCGGKRTGLCGNGDGCCADNTSDEAREDAARHGWIVPNRVGFPFSECMSCDCGLHDAPNRFIVMPQQLRGGLCIESFLSRRAWSHLESAL